MDAFSGALTAVFFACAGVFIGWWSARLPRPWWALGYFFALALVIVHTVADYVPELSVMPPLSWMMLGRKQFIAFGFIVALVLTTPMSRLPRKQDRVALGALMALVICIMSIWPFLTPLLDRDELSRLKTEIDANGVCRQGTDYTCGPASAVTALRKLGFPAEEGHIGIISSTSSGMGTPDDILAESLEKEYGKEGLVAEFRIFKDIAELKQAGLTLAVIKYGLFVDHYVTVLDVTDKEVIVGDPLMGLRRISYEEFSRDWRREGVVLKRNSK